jgi:hypothetical protein
LDIKKNMKTTQLILAFVICFSSSAVALEKNDPARRIAAVGQGVTVHDAGRLLLKSTKAPTAKSTKAPKATKAPTAKSTKVPKATKAPTAKARRVLTGVTVHDAGRLLLKSTKAPTAKSTRAPKATKAPTAKSTKAPKATKAPTTKARRVLSNN